MRKSVLRTMKFSVTTTLLISLYWAEIMRKKDAAVSTFLKKSKWPFIIISIGLFTLEWVGVGFRSLWYDVNLLTTLISVVYFVFLVLPTGMFIIYGHKIQMRLRQNRGAHSDTSRRLLQATRLLIISGIGMLIMCAFVVLPLVTPLYNSVFGFPFVFAGGHLGANIATTPRILAFKPASSKRSTKPASSARSDKVTAGSSSRTTGTLSDSGAQEEEHE
jgi:hypothetical protein